MASNVIIIDDDECFRKIVELKLRSFIPNLNCRIFENIVTARAFLQDNAQDNAPQIDLVILDEHLPDGRGTDLLSEGWFSNLAVLMISSDTAAEMPGASIEAGAMFFINKVQVREDLFKPLVLGIIERSKLLKELNVARSKAIKMETIKTLIATLKHEINNPLGAVLGAAYVMRNNPNADKEQLEAAELVEESGQRIKHVLDQLCQAADIESVNKANHQVFQIPGDKPWGAK
ncbi:MAG: histidine kinase dimerization/phospho-acceptor domain-containing protein [Bdellovibrionota bacterium]|jgi:signal transduction histidine kinase